jgi:hypothetical protein
VKYFLVKCAVALFFVAQLAGQHRTPDIYLHNTYGTNIIYKTRLSGSGNVLGNLARVKLFNIKDSSVIFIRTNKTLSMFTNITSYVEEIQKETHNHPGMDACIYVKPSNLYEGWDISIDWESPEAIIDDVYTELLSGLYGVEYQKKAQEICDYDYTKATAGGFINLCNSLKKEAANINKKTYKMLPGKPAPTPSTIKDLKKLIDTLYNGLQKYRVRDKQ